MGSTDSKKDDKKTRNSFFKKLSTIFMNLTPFIVIPAVILATIAGSLVTDIFNIDSSTYTYSMIIVFSAYFIIFMIATIVFLILFSNIKGKELRNTINKEQGKCNEHEKILIELQKSTSDNLEKIRNILVRNILTEQVVAGKQINEMEANVVKGNAIHICTSRFVLEKNEEFKNVIISNLRKGVIYKYIIPDGELSYDDYCDMMKKWYRDFSGFLKDQPECEKCLQQSTEDKMHGKLWNDDYLKLINKAKEAFNIVETSKKKEVLDEIESSCIKLFSKQIETFSIDERFLYVTVAMYEQPHKKWKAIIKLPTIDKEKSYMAFYIPDENELEKEIFVEHIRKLCKIGVKKPLQSYVFER